MNVCERVGAGGRGDGTRGCDRMGRTVGIDAVCGLGSDMSGGAGVGGLGSATILYKSITVCSRSARSTGNRQSLKRLAYVLYLEIV